MFSNSNYNTLNINILKISKIQNIFQNKIHSSKLCVYKFRKLKRLKEFDLRN